MLASHTSGIMREAVGGIYSNLSEAEQLSVCLYYRLDYVLCGVWCVVWCGVVV